MNGLTNARSQGATLQVRTKFVKDHAFPFRGLKQLCRRSATQGKVAGSQVGLGSIRAENRRGLDQHAPVPSGTIRGRGW